MGHISNWKGNEEYVTHHKPVPPPILSKNASTNETVATLEVSKSAEGLSRLSQLAKGWSRLENTKGYLRSDHLLSYLPLAEVLRRRKHGYCRGHGGYIGIICIVGSGKLKLQCFDTTSIKTTERRCCINIQSSGKYDILTGFS